MYKDYVEFHTILGYEKGQYRKVGLLLFTLKNDNEKIIVYNQSLKNPPKITSKILRFLKTLLILRVIKTLPIFREFFNFLIILTIILSIIHYIIILDNPTQFEMFP